MILTICIMKIDRGNNYLADLAKSNKPPVKTTEKWGLLVKPIEQKRNKLGTGLL